MLRKVTLHQPELPDGYPIEVPPLGVIENGATVEVDIEDDVAEKLSTGYGISVEGIERPVEVVVEDTDWVEEGGDEE